MHQALAPRRRRRQQSQLAKLARVAASETGEEVEAHEENVNSLSLTALHPSIFTQCM
jgi:hypothetical protein